MDRTWQIAQVALAGVIAGVLLVLGLFGPHLAVSGQPEAHGDDYGYSTGTYVSAVEAEFLADKVAIATATADVSAALTGVPALTEAERLEWSEDAAVGDFGD